MKQKTRKATKRRIPKEPGKTKCAFTFEVDGEIVLMKVDCVESCLGNEMPKDICWSNLVKAISSSALPDRIILYGKRMMICDRVLVSLLRNASLLVRRIGVRLDEIQRIGRNGDSMEAKRLSDLIRALLYDIPQLINRDFHGNSKNSNPTECNKQASHANEFDSAKEILGKKALANLDIHSFDVAKKV